jgi:hypothetical protein
MAPGDCDISQGFFLPSFQIFFIEIFRCKLQCVPFRPMSSVGNELQHNKNAQGRGHGAGGKMGEQTKRGIDEEAAEILGFFVYVLRFRHRESTLPGRCDSRRSRTHPVALL